MTKTLNNYEEEVEKLADNYYSWGGRHTEDDFKRDVTKIILQALQNQRLMIVKEVKGRRLSKKSIMPGFTPTQAYNFALDEVIKGLKLKGK
jgi:hypothetical protein